MKIDLAIKIVAEFQKWRRGESPYDGDTPETHRVFDYSQKVLGDALDSLLTFSRETLKAQNFIGGLVSVKAESHKKI